jgi:hypothetical protein
MPPYTVAPLDGIRNKAGTGVAVDFAAGGARAAFPGLRVERADAALLNSDAPVGLLVVSLGGGSLTKLSRGAANLFTTISFLQLGLACLMAPIFTAGAITQEKDNQTYNVLLATPLSNAQIVLGSLLSRLYFVLALLACGIPIFLITQLYGGVPGRTILLSFMIAASTARRLITGSVPGIPRHTGQTCVLGGAPDTRASQPQKIFERVEIWAWTSMPMIAS